MLFSQRIGLLQFAVTTHHDWVTTHLLFCTVSLLTGSWLAKMAWDNAVARWALCKVSSYTSCPRLVSTLAGPNYISNSPSKPSTHACMGLGTRGGNHHFSLVKKTSSSPNFQSLTRSPFFVKGVNELRSKILASSLLPAELKSFKWHEIGKLLVMDQIRKVQEPMKGLMFQLS